LQVFNSSHISKTGIQSLTTTKSASNPAVISITSTDSPASACELYHLHLAISR